LLSLDQIKHEVTEFRRATSQPGPELNLNLNFFSNEEIPLNSEREFAWKRTLEGYYHEHHLDITAPPVNTTVRRAFNQDHLQLVGQIRPSVVSFHFGLPEALMVAQIRAWGVHVWSSATTVEEAQWLEPSVDAIIAQGVEAGGHRGIFLSNDITSQRPLAQLLPLICAAVSVPVIAAGGCGFGNSAKWFELGASAIQVGSPFLLSHEARVNATYRKGLREVGATAVTNVFSGRPARALVNRLVKEQGPMSASTCGFPFTANAVGPLRSKAEATGSYEFTHIYRSQVWHENLDQNLKSAMEIVEEINAKLPAAHL
jgi:nitronate monooxygenase